MVFRVYGRGWLCDEIKVDIEKLEGEIAGRLKGLVE